MYFFTDCRMRAMAESPADTEPSTDAGGGRRERKKQRTRMELVNAAVQLFRDKGYEETTVAEIAAAADVSPRTFFLHFPTKKDILLAEGGLRADKGLEVVASRLPGEAMVDLLLRAVRGILQEAAERSVPTGLAELRIRLLAEVPELVAAEQLRTMDAQARLAAALQAACPEQDSALVSALVGAVVGALVGAGDASLRRGDGIQVFLAVVDGAMERAAAGFRS